MLYDIQIKDAASRQVIHVSTALALPKLTGLDKEAITVVLNALLLPNHYRLGAMGALDKGRNSYGKHFYFTLAFRPDDKLLGYGLKAGQFYTFSIAPYYN